MHQCGEIIRGKKLGNAGRRRIKLCPRRLGGYFRFAMKRPA